MIGRRTKAPAPARPTARPVDHECLQTALRPVQGWLHRGEAVELYESARLKAATIRDRPIKIVEIGSYHGRSTIALALGLRAGGGNGLVHAIDAQVLEIDQLEMLKQNLSNAGVTDLVEVVVSTSHEARPEIADGAVDVLFVDGSHQYEDVLIDIADWTTSLRDGAVAAFNDPYWVSVGRAMQDGLAQRGSPFRRPRWADKTVFFDYLPNAAWTRRDMWEQARLRAYLKVGRRWWVIHERHLAKKLRPGSRISDAEIRLVYRLFGLLLRASQSRSTW